jgi:hypothetical protein
MGVQADRIRRERNRIDNLAVRADLDRLAGWGRTAAARNRERRG